jgi:hypothetical protein
MSIEDVIKYFPKLHFDQNEPFYPQKIGYQVYEAEHYLSIFPSPTYKRLLYFLTEITEAEVDAKYIIEYSLWYNADIQHLYELEHLWVYLDENKNVIKVEGSRHGYIKDLKLNESINVEPGKHGHFQGELTERAKQIFASIASTPGTAGLLADIDCPDLRDFGAFLSRYYKSIETDEAVINHLAKYSFVPTFQFNEFAPSQEVFIAWRELKEFIVVDLQKKLVEIKGSNN